MFDLSTEVPSARHQRRINRNVIHNHAKRELAKSKKAKRAKKVLVLKFVINVVNITQCIIPWFGRCSLINV